MQLANYQKIHPDLFFCILFFFKGSKLTTYNKNCIFYHKLSQTTRSQKSTCMPKIATKCFNYMNLNYITFSKNATKIEGHTFFGSFILLIANNLHKYKQLEKILHVTPKPQFFQVYLLKLPQVNTIIQLPVLILQISSS